MLIHNCICGLCLADHAPRWLIRSAHYVGFPMVFFPPRGWSGHHLGALQLRLGATQLAHGLVEPQEDLLLPLGSNGLWGGWIGELFVEVRNWVVVPNIYIIYIYIVYLFILHLYVLECIWDELHKCPMYSIYIFIRFCFFGAWIEYDRTPSTMLVKSPLFCREAAQRPS